MARTKNKIHDQFGSYVDGWLYSRSWGPPPKQPDARQNLRKVSSVEYNMVLNVSELSALICHFFDVLGEEFYTLILVIASKWR